MGRQAEKANARGDSRELFAIMKQLRTRYTLKTNSGGKLVYNDPITETEAWKTHFQQIQNGDETVNNQVWRNIKKRTKNQQWMMETPTTHIIVRTIKKMKS